ncbi:hypothetical protein [Devosia sp.]|uniref:hypothetical protein n=1 Tax=Devosia sp. TaxID=1871048 RepID=UPI001B203B69|nr:hypothetical protein [Devosia sp.]MBO9589086.1 hypothetical protein [Devosia sp.]
MTDQDQTFLRVSVVLLDEGYAVLGFTRGPVMQRIGDYHATQEAAMAAARQVNRKHDFVGFRDVRELS